MTSQTGKQITKIHILPNLKIWVKAKQQELLAKSRVLFFDVSP